MFAAACSGWCSSATKMQCHPCSRTSASTLSSKSLSATGRSRCALDKPNGTLRLKLAVAPLRARRERTSALRPLIVDLSSPAAFRAWGIMELGARNRRRVSLLKRLPRHAAPTTRRAQLRRLVRVHLATIGTAPNAASWDKSPPLIGRRDVGELENATAFILRLNRCPHVLDAFVDQGHVDDSAHVVESDGPLPPSREGTSYAGGASRDSSLVTALLTRARRFPRKCGSIRPELRRSGMPLRIGG